VTLLNLQFPGITDGSLRLDLSRARNLEKLELVCFNRGVGWIVEALRTVAPDHQNLKIFFEHAELTHQPPVEGRDEDWVELDQLLVRLSESHSIRPKFVHLEGLSQDCMDHSWREAERLFPKATSGGILERTILPPRQNFW